MTPNSIGGFFNARPIFWGALAPYVATLICLLVSLPVVLLFALAAFALSDNPLSTIEGFAIPIFVLILIIGGIIAFLTPLMGLFAIFSKERIKRRAGIGYILSSVLPLSALIAYRFIS